MVLKSAQMVFDAMVSPKENTTTGASTTIIITVRVVNIAVVIITIFLSSHLISLFRSYLNVVVHLIFGSFRSFIYYCLIVSFLF